MLTLICGIPNAGKTTYSKNFENVIHLDEIQSTQFSPTREIELLLKGVEGDVCVEGVYCSARSRKKLLESYEGKGTTCIWLDTSIDVCVSREDRNRSTVLVRNCAHVFEPPTYEEGWDEIIVIQEV